MRPWSLVLLLPPAPPPLPQEEAPAEPPAAAPAPTPAPAPAAEKPAEKPPRPSAAPSAPAPSLTGPADEDNRLAIRDDAQFVINYLLTGDVRSIVSMIAFPFQLEERRFDAPEPRVVTWVKQLRDKRTDLITLYDIEVLPYADFEKKYGRPPARLGATVPRGVGGYAAVANLSGHAAVLLYRPSLEGWRAFAYTD